MSDVTFNFFKNNFGTFAAGIVIFCFSIFNLGCLHPVACVRSRRPGFFIPSTQRHYRRLILLLNTTYSAPSLKKKYIISSDYSIA
jgi:hypothetical protein